MSPGVLLLLSHLASPQRAARLGLAVAVAAMIGFAATRTGMRRLRITGMMVVATGLSLAAVVSSVVLAMSMVNQIGGPADTVVSVATSNNGLGVNTRQTSVQSRFNQWAVVSAEIAKDPLFGQGLGGTFVHYDEGFKIFVTSDIAHNIGLDLLRRTGIVGLALFVTAFVFSSRFVIRTWRVDADNHVAALSVAAWTLLLGLLAKGMFESIFEKNRLALLLGILVGIIASAASSHGSRSPRTDDQALVEDQLRPSNVSED